MKKTMCNSFSKLVVSFVILTLFFLYYFRNITNMEYLDGVSSTDTNFVNVEDKIEIDSQTSGNAKNSNDQTPHSYLDIAPLQTLVQNYSQNGSILISDVDMDDFLSAVEKDNEKWNISSLSLEQIKEITNEEGKVKTIISSTQNL